MALSIAPALLRVSWILSGWLAIGDDAGTGLYVDFVIAEDECPQSDAGV